MQKTKINNLGFYTLAHLCVDMTCMWLMAGFFLRYNIGLSLKAAVFYNFFAFAFQPVLGLITDKFKMPKQTAAAGFLLTLAGVVCVNVCAPLAIFLIGVGNAAFHIGAGVLVFNLNAKSPAFTGVFVCSGALGLALGALLFKMNFGAEFFVLLICALFVSCLFIKSPQINYSLPAPQKPAGIIWAVVILLLSAIIIRSFIGHDLGLAYVPSAAQKWIMVFAIVFGKALGGFAADKWGMLKAGVIPLAAAAPLLFAGRFYFPLIICGLFLFQFAMPIALYLLWQTMPRRPAFAFGLNCFALFVGSIPFFAGARYLPVFNTILILYAALCVGFAVKSLPVNLADSSVGGTEELT
ncbi:MAG: hypothetical protein LBG46_00965 [Elusimicrobiota bacterium]|jgi:FSR family fosmidomycin resistance protein-like MFS transporter|nr:hypothetical protein [Elusimicrobiota bacterium]